MIKIKRIYEPPEKSDGHRILIDRLWPRGIKKEDAALDSWHKEVAPSTELRKWFHHEPDKWEDFKLRYIGELKDNPALGALIEEIKANKMVTLLYGAKDEQYNQAVVLIEFIKNK